MISLKRFMRFQAAKELKPLTESGRAPCYELPDWPWESQVPQRWFCGKLGTIHGLAVKHVLLQSRTGDARYAARVQ